MYGASEYSLCSVSKVLENRNVLDILHFQAASQYYVRRCVLSDTDRVAWSVCRSVCHDREPCKTCWTDRDAVWVVDSEMGPRKHVLGGVHIGATWQIPLNRPCAAAFCQVTLTTCFVIQPRSSSSTFLRAETTVHRNCHKIWFNSVKFVCKQHSHNCLETSQVSLVGWLTVVQWY